LLGSRPLRALCAALFSIALLAPAPMAGAQADERFFSQTGFRIDDNAFWDFFQHRGAVRTFGYPVSRTFMLDGFQVQIFQREVVQKQPDGSVQMLNLLDPGLMPYTRINGSTFPAPDPAVVSATPPATNLDAILEFVRAQAPDTFEGEPVNFGATFFSTVTAADAPDADPGLLPGFDLQIWGAPTSRPARDPANNNFIYQRFQRGIMHYDKACGCTQGLLLADYLKAILTGQNLPPDLAAQVTTSKYYRQYAPGQPRAIARPFDLQGSDLTDAFVQQQAGQPGTAGPTTPAPTTSSFAYGFQVHMWDLSAQAKDFVVSDVRQAGFNWVKNQVEWQAVETAPGQYNWAELDNIVNMENSSGLKILLSVAHAPAFYRGPNSGLMPQDPATFQTLMQAMATRYRGKVQAYELWNEENLSREAGVGNVNPATYLPLLKAGFTGVKAGDNTALAVLGALSPTGTNNPGEAMDDLQYLQGLYAINSGEVKSYFDVLAGHLSGFSNPPDCTPATPQCSLSGAWNENPSFFAFSRVGQYREAMQANGDANKQIWLTEFGYDSCQDQPVPAGFEYCAYISEDTQARFLVQAVQMARQTPYIGGLMIWNLNYQVVVPSTDEKWGFSVLRSDWSGRPAFFALAAMAKS
jgi:polysaccharide biosynthesis protein PslG